LDLPSGSVFSIGTEYTMFSGLLSHGI